MRRAPRHATLNMVHQKVCTTASTSLDCGTKIVSVNRIYNSLVSTKIH